MSDIAGIESTLDYWFGPLTADGLPASGRFELWFGKDDAMDTEIRQRFGPQLAAAGTGHLDHWADTLPGLLALVITLDQLSRNIHRDTPLGFANDGRALALALDVLDHGLDHALPMVQRAFLYMPLEHAEDAAVQERCVRCFESLHMDAAPAARELAGNFLDYARRHRDIIVRFGRFPHRNRILGRQSTAAELEFLREPDSSF